MKTYLRISIAIITLCFSLSAIAQGATTDSGGTPDYAREARWAAEVVPSLVVGDAVKLNAAGRDFLGIFTPGKIGGANKPGIVLVHGVGVHPDFGLIGELRTRLADLGFATLSIQMPVLSKEVTDGNEYAKTFDVSTARIRAGYDWLAKQINRPVILLSHSMGSWMSNVYFDKTPQSPYTAWVCLSITGRIGSMGGNTLPIFDVQAENDIAPVKRGSWLRTITLVSHAKSKRSEVPQTDHQYSGKEAVLAAQVTAFIEGL